MLLVSPHAIGSERASEEAGQLCPARMLTRPKELRTGGQVSPKYNSTGQVCTENLGIPETALAPIPVLQILIVRLKRHTRTVPPRYNIAARIKNNLSEPNAQASQREQSHAAINSGIDGPTPLQKLAVRFQGLDLPPIFVEVPAFQPHLQPSFHKPIPLIVKNTKPLRVPRPLANHHVLTKSPFVNESKPLCRTATGLVTSIALPDNSTVWWRQGSLGLTERVPQKKILCFCGCCCAA
jgi:hypothetical protein